MTPFIHNNVSGITVRNERAEFGTQSGIYARSMLLSTLCRDAKDAPFHAQLATLFNLSECSQQDYRAEVERFIRETFATAYGAEVNGFMPRLLAIRSKQDELLAAFGDLTGFSVLCNTSLNNNGRGFINRTSDLFAYGEKHGLDGYVINETFVTPRSS